MQILKSPLLTNYPQKCKFKLINGVLKFFKSFTMSRFENTRKKNCNDHEKKWARKLERERKQQQRLKEKMERSRY